jgi:hypothetical protein
MNRVRNWKKSCLSFNHQKTDNKQIQNIRKFTHLSFCYPEYVHKVQLIKFPARSCLENRTYSKYNGRRWRAERSQLRDQTSWGRLERQRSYRRTISSVEVFFPRRVAATRRRGNKRVVKHLQGHCGQDTQSDVIYTEPHLISLHFPGCFTLP